MTYVSPDGLRRVGVYGGTFDPIHVGGLIVAEDVRCALKLDHVLFVPNRQPPHKADRMVTRFEDRVAMVRLAIASNEAFRLDLSEVERPGPSYAMDTMKGLKEKFGQDTDFVFILGFDALRDLDTWHEPDAFLKESKLAVMDRPDEKEAGNPGHAAEWERLVHRFPSLLDRIDIVHVPQIAISGHNIRRRVYEGLSIRYQVPHEVEEHIRERGLYRSAETSR